MKYILSFIVLVGVAGLAALLYLYSGVRFDAYKIIDYKPNLSTQVYDRNGKLIANLYKDHHRLFAPYEKIPPRIIEALVAIEDTAYFEHKGINIEAIFRAIIKDIKAMKLVEGASTITQQLIKNVALSPEKRFIRKLKEMVLAFKIESSLTKEEILERYLNQVYFGHGYYGIKTAAHGYFHKELENLTLKEVSMLVGLPKAPSSYDPTKHIDLSLSRANQVLFRMQSLGWISKNQYNNAIEEKPKVYNESLTRNKAPYVIDQVIREAGERFGDLRAGGYKIYLGLDIRLQEMAQKTLKKGYLDILKRTHQKENNQTQQNGALVAVENKTGNILALVGGVDYAKSSFNRAVQSRRQPGSSFKPFIYQIALNLGYSPISQIADISRVYEENNREAWKPKNYSGSLSGLIKLKEALIHSKNLATINLVNAVGLDTLHKKIENLGFKNVPMDLSIALGSFGISPLDFAKYYSMFPNGGEAVEPHLITSVVDRFGNKFNYDAKKETFTTPEQAYLMVDIMKGVVQRGTGKKARINGIELAGKTGTTNDNVDAWFCGYSPDVAVLIWYGRDDNKPMGKKETGSKVAPVFKEFMSNYIELYPQTTRIFKKPSGVYSRTIDGDKIYFTKQSPLPKTSNIQTAQSTTRELLF